MKKYILRIIITLLVGFIYYYFVLPPINPTSMSFYIFILFMFITYIITGMFNFFDTKVYNISVNDMIKKQKIFYIIPICIILIILVNIFYSPLFNSKLYKNRISINEDASFNEDIQKVDTSHLPLLDKESSQKLGDRVMGEMSDMVSQFSVSNLYTQINYNDEILRVTPLEYANIIKTITNSKKGITGYITVNSVDGEANLVKLDKGMKYVPSAIFNKDLYRHLRFKYPTEIFGQYSFEIDNEGNPYYIVPILKYKGVEMLKDVKGVIIVDPITGDSKKYTKDIPKWIDHVYPADLIMQQIDDWGKYNQGFFNSIFGQKNVVVTTRGYNYTIQNDDVYMYTGITSVASDESNLGFVLTNLRTKETSYYKVSGAEEYSAMNSAQGQVQQMNYKSTFPLLINLNGNPTYLVSLKDNAGLVKMYGLIDVKDYQKVVVTEASKGIDEAIKNYLANVDIDPEEDVKPIEKEITVGYISSAVINNSTIYYIEDSDGNKYSANIKIDKNGLPFIKNGDTINIKYIDNENIKEIKEIKEL